MLDMLGLKSSRSRVPEYYSRRIFPGWRNLSLRMTLKATQNYARCLLYLLQPEKVKLLSGDFKVCSTQVSM